MTKQTRREALIAAETDALPDSALDQVTGGTLGTLMTHILSTLSKTRSETLTPIARNARA